MIRRHTDTSKKIPLFAGLSIIEISCLIFLPILMMGIIYMMLPGMVWWLRIIISVGSITLLNILLFLIITLLVNITD